MSSSVYIGNKGEDVLIFGRSPTEGLDDTTLIAEAHYSINFSRSKRTFYLILHYNGRKSFVFVNCTKLFQEIFQPIT